MQQKPIQQHPFIFTLGRILLKRRWLVFVAGILMVFLVETIEHWPNGLTLDRYFLTEIFIYGIAGPFLVWVLLTMLAQALTMDARIDQIQAQATEAERKRIARDLHDKLAQNLGYLHFKLDQIAASGEATLPGIESIQTDLEQMRQIANQAYEQVRGTLDSLRVEAKRSDDLAVVLRQQAQAMANRTGFEMQIDYPDDIKSFCPLVNRTIIDIAHEALINVDKHAEASRVTISLGHEQADAFLTITDNGQGFSQDVSTSSHHGINIMYERVEEVGGRLEIKSAPGQGTQLIAQFPNAVVSKPLLQKCEHLQCELECHRENTLS